MTQEIPRSRAKHPGLWLDLLGREDPLDVSQQRVPSEQLEVASQLLHAVDLSAPLHLDRRVGAGRVSTEQIDGSDRRRILAADERPAVAQRLGMLGQ